MAYLHSITTGNPVHCMVLKRSWLRRLLFMPSVQVQYIYEGLAGASAWTISWRYPSDVHEEIAGGSDG